MLYNCLLCKNSIKSDGEGSHVLDPCQLVLVAAWGEKNQQSQAYFCHYECFLKFNPSHLQIDPDYSPDEVATIEDEIEDVEISDISECNFRHLTLSNGNILTICSKLGYEVYRIGYCVYNRHDTHYSKNNGKKLAYERCVNQPVNLRLKHGDERNNLYLTWLAVERIYLDMLHRANQLSPFPSDTIAATHELARGLNARIEHAIASQNQKFFENRLNDLTADTLGVTAIAQWTNPTAVGRGF